MMRQVVKKIFSIFQKPVNIRQSWINEPARFQSMVDFLNWFNSTSSITDTVQKAQRDWAERLTNFSHFRTLSKKTCLEIGFGSGRLSVPASRCFETIIGIDIHSAFEMTREFLKSQGVKNYRLIHRNEIEYLEKESIGFVYSFIVFQHFDSFNEVDFYLKHIKRILSHDGYAHIFFGKLSEGKGVMYTDPRDFQKRACSLFIEPRLFRQHLGELGFTVIEYEDKMPKRFDKPLSSKNESGQARVLFRK